MKIQLIRHRVIVPGLLFR